MKTIETEFKELRNKATELKNKGNQQEIVYANGVLEALKRLEKFSTGLEDFSKENKKQSKVRKLYGRR